MWAPGSDSVRCQQPNPKPLQGLVPHPPAPDEISGLATKVITKRSTAEKIGNVTISLGVARFRMGMSPIDFFKAADTLLYASKRAGKNRISTQTVDMRQIA